MKVTSADGGFTATADAVDGAAAYVFHVTPVGKTGPSNATIMFYSETPSITVPADTASRNVGDKIYVYAQASPFVGQGADNTAKAEWLNEHNDGTESAWSSGVSVTIA